MLFVVVLDVVECELDVVVVLVVVLLLVLFV
jgi:hypothetical protein